jgi:hypothetical protein
MLSMSRVRGLGVGAAIVLGIVSAVACAGSEPFEDEELAPDAVPASERDASGDAARDTRPSRDATSDRDSAEDGSADAERASDAEAGASDGGTDAGDDAARSDASRDATTDAPRATSLLEQAGGCAAALFRRVYVNTGFATAAEVNADFTQSYVRSRPSARGLEVGPHPLTGDWWENYSVIRTSGDAVGAALACVRVSAFVPAQRAVDAEVLDLSVHGLSEGAVLKINLASGEATVRRRLADGTWVDYASFALTLPREREVTFEALLAGVERRYLAEVRVLATPAVPVARLRASVPIAQEGPSGLTGWRLSRVLRVERFTLGEPSPLARAAVTE